MFDVERVLLDFHYPRDDALVFALVKEPFERVAVSHNLEMLSVDVVVKEF